MSRNLPKHVKAANQKEIEKEIETEDSDDTIRTLMIPENTDSEAALSNHCDEIPSSYEESADCSPLHRDGNCSPEMLYDEDDSRDNEAPDQIFTFEAHSTESNDVNVVGDKNIYLGTPSNKECDTEATPPNIECNTGATFPGEEGDTVEAIDMDVIGDQVTKTIIQEIHARPECGKEFSTGEAMENHKNTHDEISHLQTHVEELYICKVCMEVFSSKAGLDKHRRNHNTNEKTNDTSITPKASPLQTHVEESFNCKECMEVFSSKAGLDEHRQDHTNENTDDPSITPKASRSKNPKKLTTVQSKAGRHICDKCRINFSRHCNLINHIKVHHDTRPETNSDEKELINGKVTRVVKKHKSSDKLEHHSNTARGVNDKPVCDKCGMRYAKISQLINHMKKVHKEMLYEHTESAVQCKICSKWFSTQSSLQRHSSIHTGSKPYKCPKCPKHFRAKFHMEMHSKIHSGILYRCDICSKCFTLKSNFVRHYKVHTGENGFTCAECGKSFRRKDHMELHVQVHSDVGYKCEICLNDYATLNGLKRHQLVHSSEKRYVCSICENRFRRKDHLDKHIENIHEKKAKK